MRKRTRVWGLRTAGGLEFEESGLIKLLRCKNGFYAIEGALHVLPSSSAAREYGLAKWNSHNFITLPERR